MTAFLLTIAATIAAVVLAVIIIAWPVASLMREADLGGWENE